MSGVMEITDATFAREVLESSETTLVEFWASWCGPCRAVSPIIDQIAADHPGKLRIVKINLDDNPISGANYQVTSIPAMKVFRNGEVVKTIIGAKPKPAMEHELAAFLA